MQVDLELDLEPVTPSRPEPFRSQVCIVGAGIAGLVLATTLADSGMDVHLLEAGGPIPEERSQAIYLADMADALHTGATQGRFRTFGGSSTQWGGQLLPYPDDVFSPPPCVPSAPWPLWRSGLSPFYTRVEDLLGAGHLPFTADLFRFIGRTLPPALLSDPDIALRASKWAPFARRNLAQTLGKHALASPKVTVFFHANATELLLAPDGSRLSAVLVGNYHGQTFRFQADRYILAAGTIESSRLLLASRSVAAAGVGNDHDQVGRGFHDHLSYPAALLTGPARAALLQWFAPVLDEDGVTHTAKLEASPALRRRLGLLNVMAHLSIEEPADSGAAVVRSLLQSLQRGKLRAALADSLTRLPAASVDIVRLAYDAHYNQRRFVSRAASVTLRIDSEQPARAENRVRLSDDLDPLGQPRAIIDWRVSGEERRSLSTFALFLRDHLLKMGVPPIHWPAELNASDPEAPLDGITDTYHPMGGTIMGTNPATSVVDPDLRLHGVDNLFVAGCGTFPAGGSSNPTFTLMALALRLAERLAHP